MKQPRWYQQEALKALLTELDKGNRPYAAMCTGSGKSLVAAMLSSKFETALQIVPTQELVIQNQKECVELVGEEMVGVCCASFALDINKRIIIGTPVSILNRIGMLKPPELIIIDECHRGTLGRGNVIINICDYFGMPKICGLTATPYTGTGIMLHNIEEPLFTNCCYETSIFKLTQEGYLSPIEYIETKLHANMEGVKVLKTGEYDEKEMGLRFSEVLPLAVTELKEKFAELNIKTAVVFCATVENANMFKNLFGDCAIVDGKTPDKMRDDIISWLKHGIEDLRVIVNCGVLTTGFDYQELDAVVFLRATQSTPLYVQIVGRVMRAHHNKEVGYVFDYGENLIRHGSIYNISLNEDIKKINHGESESDRESAKKENDQLLITIQYSPVSGLVAERHITQKGKACVKVKITFQSGSTCNVFLSIGYEGYPHIAAAEQVRKLANDKKLWIDRSDAGITKVVGLINQLKPTHVAVIRDNGFYKILGAKYENARIFERAKKLT